MVEFASISQRIIARRSLCVQTSVFLTTTCVFNCHLSSTRFWNPTRGGRVTRRLIARRRRPRRYFRKRAANLFIWHGIGVNALGACKIQCHYYYCCSRCAIITIIIIIVLNVVKVNFLRVTQPCKSQRFRGVRASEKSKNQRQQSRVNTRVTFRTDWCLKTPKLMRGNQRCRVLKNFLL